MDNITPIGQEDLNKYMGLTPGATPASDPGTDASKSKTMKVDNTKNEITYTYQRGGVTLTGTINYATQGTTWSVTGGGIVKDDNRHKALAEGLKIPTDSLSVT